MTSNRPVSEMVKKASFAWTPAPGAYEHYPQYVNLTGNKLTIRGPEFVNDDGHYEMGPTVSIELPNEALAELRAASSQFDFLEPSDDVVERVARAIAADIVNQDYMAGDWQPAEDWDFTFAYLDQGEVDFRQIAAAAIHAVSY